MSGVLIQDRLVHYEIFGRGKPILFLHGWLGSWRYWVPVMEEVSGERRAYALDLWGFGDSDKTCKEYDIDAYAEMVMTFMDELGIWRAPIVGHTLGAAIALKLAQKCPERIEKVMAVSVPLTAEAINRKLLVAAPNEALARLFWQRQRPYPEVEAGLAKAAQNVIAQTLQSVARLDLAEIVGEIEVPLLIVCGDRDGVVNPAAYDQIEKTDSPCLARAIVLPGAAHFPMLDETAKFSRLLRDLLDVTTATELFQLSIKEEWRRRMH